MDDGLSGKTLLLYNQEYLGTNHCLAAECRVGKGRRVKILVKRRAHSLYTLRFQSMTVVFSSVTLPYYIIVLH